jgi:hypothetical protein
MLEHLFVETRTKTNSGATWRDLRFSLADFCCLDEICSGSFISDMMLRACRFLPWIRLGLVSVAAASFIFRAEGVQAASSAEAPTAPIWRQPNHLADALKGQNAVLLDIDAADDRLRGADRRRVSPVPARVRSQRHDGPIYRKTASPW